MSIRFHPLNLKPRRKYSILISISILLTVRSRVSAKTEAIRNTLQFTLLNTFVGLETRLTRSPLMRGELSACITGCEVPLPLESSWDKLLIKPRTFGLYRKISNFSLAVSTCYRSVHTARPQFEIFLKDLTLG